MYKYLMYGSVYVCVYACLNECMNKYKCECVIYLQVKNIHQKICMNAECVYVSMDKWMYINE